MSRGSKIIMAILSIVSGFIINGAIVKKTYFSGCGYSGPGDVGGCTGIVRYGWPVQVEMIVGGPFPWLRASVNIVFWVVVVWIVLNIFALVIKKVISSHS